MFKKHISIILVAILSQSCIAEPEQEKTIGFSVGGDANSFFSSRYYDAPSISKKDDFSILKTLDWFKPFHVKDSRGENKSIKNCDEFIKGRDQLSESIPSEYSKFRYYLMHCIAIENVINSKDSFNSYLPKQLVSEESPNILPKEFIPVVSKSDREALDAMLPSARWIDGIKLIKSEDLGNNRIMFSQEGQKQILSELARADFNGDGLEDSLVYLRTTLDGGSWESDVIITVTAGEDGVIRMLDVYPND
jgi:hypothetical protein|nr:hypothetical protein [Providencia huaxiensis]